MKRLNLLIFMSLCSYTLQAQWGFSATLKASGECSAYINMSLPRITGFPTKSECEAARAQILSIRVSSRECSLYYICSSCAGHDIGGTQKEALTSTTISVPDQSAPNFTPNPARTVQDWMDEYQLKMQALGFDNANAFLFPLSGNKGFDQAYNDQQQRYVTRDPATIAYYRGLGPKPIRDKTGGRPGALGGFTIIPSAPRGSVLGRGQMAVNATGNSDFAGRTASTALNVEKKGNGIYEVTLTGLESLITGETKGVADGTASISAEENWQHFTKVIEEKLRKSGVRIKSNLSQDERVEFQKKKESNSKILADPPAETKNGTRIENNTTQDQKPMSNNLRQVTENRKIAEKGLQQAETNFQQKDPNNKNKPCITTDCDKMLQTVVALQDLEKKLKGIGDQNPQTENKTKNK